MHLIQKQQIENATFRRLTRKARKMAKQSTPWRNAKPSVSMSTRLNSNAKHGADKTIETSFESFSRFSAEMSPETHNFQDLTNAARIPSAAFSDHAAAINFPLNCSAPIPWQSSASRGVSPYQASLVQDKATSLYQPKDVITAFLMGAAAAQLNPPSGLQIDSRTCSLLGRLA